MPQDDKDKEKEPDNPVSVILDEVKKLRAEVEELKKENTELREYAVESTRRVFDTNPKQENSDDKLEEIVEYYKKGY